MTEIQIRLWDKMIQLIRDYDHRSLSFNGLVRNLKETMELGNFEEEILQGWRGAWAPFQKMGLDNPLIEVEPQAVQPWVENMRTYLLEHKMAQASFGRVTNETRGQACLEKDGRPI